MSWLVSASADKAAAWKPRFLLDRWVLSRGVNGVGFLRCDDFVTLGLVSGLALFCVGCTKRAYGTFWLT